MANNTSLYTYVTSPNVASNNFTTLYNGVTSVGVNTNYGNANVEAFLNAGTDGSNSVQNINMSGNITVGGNTNLGTVSTVHIGGGDLNYVLETDGSGGLNWVPLPNFTTNVTSYIHFAVNSTANNQSFTNANLIVYANNYTMAVMKNGINIEPSQYNIAGNVLTINIPLSTGDTIDVLPSYSGAPNVTPGGITTSVQYNGGSGQLSGNVRFTYDQANNKLSVGNIVTDSVNLAASRIAGTGSSLELIGNVSNNTTGLLLFDNGSSVLYGTNVTIQSNHINGDIKEWYFLDDGNLTFPDGSIQSTAYIAGTVSVAGSNTQVQFNDGGIFGANANFTFNKSTNTLTVPNIVGNIANANYANFAGSALTADSATTSGNSNYSNTANIANTANYANFAGNAFAVNGANVVGMVSLANSANYANYANFAGNVESSNVANYANYANFAGTAYSVAGANVTGTVANATFATNANYAAYAGNITIANQPNITGLGTVANLVTSNFTSTGNLIIQRAYEKYTTVGTGATGTVNFELLDQSILFYTSNATANFTLNVRGNVSSTLDSVLPIGDVVTVVMLNTVGTTPYVANVVKIDGTTITPKYVNAATPTSGIRLANCVQSYTYTIVKTGSNAYTTLGQLSEYQ